MKAETNIRELYENNAAKKYVYLALALMLTLLSGLYFITIGIKDTSVEQVFGALYSWYSGNWQLTGTPALNKIIVFMRIPRIALAFFAGIGLACAGTVMQSVMRNYLVSPFTLGISAASAFGASICIVFGSGAFFESEIGMIASAFVSAMLCVFVVFGLARKVGLGPSAIILIGIGLNYFFSAMTAAIEFFAVEHKLEAVVQWTFGTFNRAGWHEVTIVGIIVLGCYLCLTSLNLKLNVMSTGDDELVKSLGVNPERIRCITGFLAVLMAAAIISFTGIIGFVGLIAPHIARIMVGNDHRFMLPCAGIVGAFLLMSADTVGRVILSPVTIPVGIVVSFLGVPLFIQLILTSRKRSFE